MSTTHTTETGPQIEFAVNGNPAMQSIIEAFKFDAETETVPPALPQFPMDTMHVLGTDVYTDPKSLIRLEPVIRRNSVGVMPSRR